MAKRGRFVKVIESEPVIKTKAEVDEDIVRIVEHMSRNGYGGVYPLHIQAWLDVDRSERQLRRDMARLARAGRLKRLGERGGFTVVARTHPATTSEVVHPVKLRTWRTRNRNK